MLKKTYYMVGMPSSGKTTYLASLCRLVSEADIETLLHMDVLEVPEGMEHIEKQIQNLLACKEVDRTLNKTQYRVQFPLTDDKGKRLDLILPDSSGEVFRDFVRDRRILKSIADKLKDAEEILFFINTNTMVKPEYLGVQEKSAMKMLEERKKTDLERHDDLSIQNIVRRKDEKTNQAEVVDLLQCILFIKEEKARIKFIISAWDKVEKEFVQERLLPKDYLQIELPLLYQYLKSNIDKVEYQIWGVSAQGGDFSDKKEKIKLQEGNPSRFIKVIDHEGNESQDLTKVLYM